MTDTIRFCPNCKLPHRPDERIHNEAGKLCPRCGYDLDQEPDWKKQEAEPLPKEWYL